MSDIVDLLASDSSNVLDTSGQIVLGHFLPRELPELVVTIFSIEGGVDVVDSVFVTSVVGNPDIITSVGKEETGSLGFVVNNEGVRGIEETVVEESNGESRSDLGVFGLNSVISQKITVLSFDGVLFNGIAEGGSEEGKVIEGFLGEVDQSFEGIKINVLVRVSTDAH